MSTGARFQFIRIDSNDQVRMASWIHHISRLTGAPASAAADSADPVFIWQLSAGNHRVLARSAAGFASVDATRRGIQSLLAARDTLVPRMVRLEASRGYGWVLLGEGAPVATCARWYAMERDRRESLRSAREAIELLAADPHHAGDALVAAGGDRE
ncbi:hypothetical protein [Protaetiibacter larvae]|uniref:Uncharacterized protein n=1 Tax=Protaetiibacter larvae TaxID=2592654 RepID=A0A5C1Y6Q2_9MICO|nr:hypothetical protein [Protaetiibacter larvae]QEO09481.1 hypothetical protein FLP23_05315 [Protaetiibacter larvae]